jgi:FtsX-like permease family
MTVARAWLRLELRRRWPSLAVLTLLIAIAGGTVITSLAGARRGASALTRLEQRTRPATAAVLANTAGFDWAPFRRLPYVEALTTFVVDYNVTSETVDGAALGFPPGDDEMLRTMERPVVYAGRALNPARPDEAVVTRAFVRHYDLGVGDSVVVRLATPQEVVAQEPSGPHGTYTGPRVRIRIVGVVETPWAADQPGSPGGLLPSPGLYRRYRQNIVGPAGAGTTNNVNALLRLRGGASDVSRLRSDVARITGRTDIDVWNLPDQYRQTQRSLAFEARCLAAFGFAALIAAIFLVGQAIVRYAAASTAELQTLRALGMTPQQSIATAAAGPAVVGALGAALAVLGGYLASRWFPIGSAELIEPSPGPSADWVVFGPAFAVLAVLVVAGAVGAASLAVGAARRATTGRRSTVAVSAARAGLPVPVVVGTRFALEPGRGRTAVPVRPALIGAVTGVLGIVAAFTFSQGVNDAIANPARFGQTFQLGAFIGANGQDFGPAPTLVRRLLAHPDVTGVDDARTAVATGPAGQASVSLWTYTENAKPLPVVVLSGRMPRTADEVLLAPQSLTALHTGVGRTVALRGSKKSVVRYRVAGSGLIPAGPHNGYADGGWITPAGYDRIFTGFKFHVVLIGVRPGARGAHAAAALTAALVGHDRTLKGLELTPPDTLAQIGQLKQVRVLPVALGVFLALLALGAVGHALATAVRRRSHDIAVLRALGMTQWQCRWVVVTQATVLALIGGLVGLPVGLAAGQTVWRAVTDYTPLQYVAPLAFWVLLLVIPAALLISNALAAWPGRRAARMRIAHVLRTE